jgi:L-ascorbate 6-phosphate lactonase
MHMKKTGTTLTFAGQAGFMIESSSGYRIGVDLYLSNCCERYFGFKRLMPYLYDPLELELDTVVATHAHYDHFDPDSVPLLLRNGKTRLVAARDVKIEADKLGLNPEQITYLSCGECYADEDVTIKALPCDHGELAPDALGLLITVDGKRIYITGDTSYREDYFSNPELTGVDVLILPINGAFGNLDALAGARAAGIIGAGLTIPCHYWNFAEHGGDPAAFATAMKTDHADLAYLLMRPGESIDL